MKNLLADGRGGWVADDRLCRSRVAAKIFVFVISLNFHEIFSFVLCRIFLQFSEIQNNFVIISCFTKFGQCSFTATLWRSGARGGTGWYSPGTPSALTQIVPYSSSLYTVFHSVIYNSVENKYSVWGRDNENAWRTIHSRTLRNGEILLCNGSTLWKHPQH